MSHHESANKRLTRTECNPDPVCQMHSNHCSIFFFLQTWRTAALVLLVATNCAFAEPPPSSSECDSLFPTFSAAVPRRHGAPRGVVLSGHCASLRRFPSFLSSGCAEKRLNEPHGDGTMSPE